MSVKDCGAAFPCAAAFGTNQSDEFLQNDAQAGMSLRDYFAAAALPAVMSARIALRETGLVGDDMNQESIAEECYELADALIAERERRR